MIRIGSVFAGRFGIIEKIGTGGMSDVYKAEDRQSGEIVAIKVLKSSLSLDPEQVERFREEGASAAELDSENIVRVYGVGEAGGTHFIVMEYVDGVTLKDYIRKKGVLSPRETLAITAQAAVGLRHAHAHHLVHRDIKPQNLILSKDGKVKITDFGIARSMNSEAKSFRNGTVGSVYYIAPEQVKGQPSDERSDIYSLGICMYEMITGQVPFDKETSMAVALAHMNESMVPPSDLNPKCPIALEQILFRCTQKSRERRYRNCTELLKDLKIAVEDPDYNFEKKEQEKLLRSNTHVFSASEVEKVRGKKPAPVPAKSGTDGETRQTREAEDTERRTSRRAPSEPAKKTADYVLFGVSAGLGIVMLILLIYIIAGFSGCINPSSHSTKNTTAPTETTETEIETVETKHVDDFDPETDAKMPDLIGKTIAEALNALEEQGLVMRLSSEEEYSEEYPAGTITKQTYPADAVIPKGTTVLVMVSAGSDKFEIQPNYVGGSIVDFRNDIAKYTSIINVEYERAYSTTVPMNVIISITPSSGTLRKGDKIKVVYSAGQPYVQVPDLTGMTAEEARTALEDLGLQLGMIYYEYDDEIEADHVMRQEKSKGSRVRVGTAVYIVISQGKEPVEKLVMPDLSGKTRQEAEDALTEAGFKYVVANQYDKDNVGKVSQYPAAGVEWPVDRSVYLYVASADPYMALPDVVGMKLSEVQTWLINTYKLKLTLKRVPVMDEAKDNVISEMSPTAGTPVDVTADPRNELTLKYMYYTDDPNETSEEETTSEETSTEEETTAEATTAEETTEEATTAEETTEEATTAEETLSPPEESSQEGADDGSSESASGDGE